MKVQGGRDLTVCYFRAMYRCLLSFFAEVPEGDCGIYSTTGGGENGQLGKITQYCQLAIITWVVISMTHHPSLFGLKIVSMVYPSFLRQSADCPKKPRLSPALTTCYTYPSALVW